jgi:hypothetical protein
MEIIARGATIEHLNTADLDNAITAFGIEARCFRIENDLSHCVAVRA